MSEFKISMILAMDENNAIGNNNDLLYFFPSDLKRFVNLTRGETVVMGRKTWESLPTKLPKRKNCVLTSLSEIEPSEKKGKMVQPDLILNNIEDALKLADSEEIWIIGGAEIYKQFFQYADAIELTKIMSKDAEFDTTMDWFDEYLEQTDLVQSNVEELTEVDSISGKEYEIQFITYENQL